jgi:hypothetical protein
MRRLALGVVATALLSAACTSYPTSTAAATSAVQQVHEVAVLVAQATPAVPICPSHQVNGHPVNCAGFVTDGTPQLDDAHCVGPVPGKDFCLAARHNGEVTNGDPQLTDQACQGSAYQVAECITARRFTHIVNGAWVGDWQPEFGCVVTIVDHEDPSWNPTQANVYGSGAYGLPQALPGSKMAIAGADWATNPGTQIRWLLDDYVGSYGGICSAAGHDVTYGTY